jgi:hypothetical protein
MTDFKFTFAPRQPPADDDIEHPRHWVNASRT